MPSCTVKEEQQRLNVAVYWTATSAGRVLAGVLGSLTLVMINLLPNS